VVAVPDGGDVALARAEASAVVDGVLEAAGRLLAERGL
jgi:hypothetical protein